MPGGPSCVVLDCYVSPQNFDLPEVGTLLSKHVSIPFGVNWVSSDSDHFAGFGHHHIDINRFLVHRSHAPNS